jgi:hypothetical protein
MKISGSICAIDGSGGGAGLAGGVVLAGTGEAMHYAWKKHTDAGEAHRMSADVELGLRPHSTAYGYQQAHHAMPARPAELHLRG